MKTPIPDNFLGISEDQHKAARVAILPVPYEATVSYGKGTEHGPRAIIEASKQVEWYDEELGLESLRIGVTTLEPLPVKGIPPSKLEAVITPAVARLISDGRLPIILGGEHSITPSIVGAVKAAHGDITVLQFDAHADLRDEYDGERTSHACAMARAREFCPVVHVGIRNISFTEAELVKKENLPVFFAHQIHQNANWMKEVLAAIGTDKVFITFDVDAFDASVMPATGTPEPGGLDWQQVTGFLRLVCEKKRVVGLDFVELAPIKGLHACDFTVAKLIYKCIGYLQING